jgi:pimeloyl-ACP methyl ester carboxylesterase
MPRAIVGDVALEYETFGTGRPLVLVMGIGAQMIFWDERFCELLAARDFQVVRFDHRDIGKSSTLDHLPVPPPLPTIVKGFLGVPVVSPYSLSDMAGDVVGLMDHIGIGKAHVAGMSMGGMIGQHLIIEHPTRVRSFTQICSTTGTRRYLPRPYAVMALLQKRARTAEQAGEAAVTTFRALGGPSFAADEDRLRELGRQSFERGQNPRGFLRQLAAIATARDRGPELRKVRTPTLVIHGTDDPLIPIGGGRATARAIPDARLVEIPGLGHDLPPVLWPRVVDLITDHAARADRLRS